MLHLGAAECPACPAPGAGTRTWHLMAPSASPVVHLTVVSLLLLLLLLVLPAFIPEHAFCCTA
jgi:uncharacterized membrane protein